MENNRSINIKSFEKGFSKEIPESIPSTVRSAREYMERLFPEFDDTQALLGYLENKTIIDVGSGLTHKNPFALINESARDKNRNINFFGVEPRLAASGDKKFSPQDKRWAFFQSLIDERLGIKGEFFHPITRPGKENVLAGIAESLPFADDSADILLSSATVGYWIDKEEDLFSIMKEFERVLKPGGEIRLYYVKPAVEKVLTQSSELADFINNSFNIKRLPVVIKNDKGKNTYTLMLIKKENKNG